jgi:hypothetical protein
MREVEIRRELVESYLLDLGYPLSLLASEVRTN